MTDDVLFPGIFDPLPDADAIALHLAGAGNLNVVYDPQDIFPGDPYLEVETPEMEKREKLPQFGPNFVTAIRQDISDVDRKLDALRRDAIQQWMYEPVTQVFVASFQTDTTGAVQNTAQGNAVIVEPAPGFTFALHLLTIRDEGHTFGNPYTNAGSWWELRLNNEMLLGNSMVSGQGQLPIVGTWGTRDAPHIRDGESLSFFMSGGPASTKISLRLQGTMDRTIEG